MVPLDARAYATIIQGPVFPERKLLVPEQPVTFDKLTPSVMGLRHGQIAERPPLAILQRMIAHDTWDTHNLFFLGIKHKMAHDPNLGFSSMGKDMADQGKAYAEAYARGVREYMENHGASIFDLEKFNPRGLVKAHHMDAFIDGLERVPYLGVEVLITDEIPLSVAMGPAPIGYRIGFAVGLARDFEVPVSFNGVPKNNREYDAFLGGLSGKEAPEDDSFSEIRSFELGQQIHEIVEQEPHPQAA